MKIKIAIAFFVVGMGLSLIGGVIAGNPFPSILLFSLVSSSILAALVFGLLTLLDLKVPEFSQFLNQIQSGDPIEIGEEEGVPASPQTGSTGEPSPMESELTSASSQKAESQTNQSEGSTTEPKNEKPKNGKFGDHIIIDNIPIKNEPKLMAEAIRTIMAQDDMGSPNQLNK